MRTNFSVQMVKHVSDIVKIVTVNIKHYSQFYKLCYCLRFYSNVKERVCDTHRGEKKWVRNFGGEKYEGRNLLERPRGRWKANI